MATLFIADLHLHGRTGDRRRFSRFYRGARQLTRCIFWRSLRYWIGDDDPNLLYIVKWPLPLNRWLIPASPALAHGNRD